MNSGNQSVVINSSPPGAKVFANGAQVGVTPFTYTYDDPSGKAASIELRKEGLQPATFDLRPREKNTVLLADALLLGIPYIIDGQSKALYAFPKASMGLNLYKAMPADVQKLDLPVTVIENGMGDGAVAGKIGGRKLTMDSREMSDLRYPETATSELLGGFSNTYVDAQSIRPGTVEGDKAARRAKVVLRPKLTALDMQLDEEDHRVYGNVHVGMDWRFFSGTRPDSVLFTISKTTDFPVYGQPVHEVLGNTLKDAARQLLDEDSLRDRISGAYAAGLTLSKGERIQLARPAPIAFADRNSMIPALVKGVVTVEMKDGHGSGFLITGNDYILTNAHVVGNSATAKVRFEQGFSLDGQVVKVNRDFDVALIKVPGNDLPALTMGDDDKAQLGEELFAIGTPLDEKLGQTVTRGILSGKREIEGRKYLQTDVSINPGNSGGPLIDDKGEVVGMATMKIEGHGVEGIGFAVPISTALDMLNIEFTK